MGDKDTTPSFVVELRLKSSPQEERSVDVSLDAGRMLVNACLCEALRRLDLMRESKAYRNALKMPKSKVRTESFASLRKQYKFKDSAIQSYAIDTKNACHIGYHLDAHTVQKVATRTFNAANRYALGKNGRPRFKGKEQFDSLESKTNANGIRYRDGWLMWRGLQIGCVIDPKDEGISYGLTRRIKYCRIVRRRVKGQHNLYTQLIVEGLSYVKDNNKPGSETVGIDIGPSTVAYVGETTAELKLFCSELEFIEKKIRLMQRAMDRSRRASNPDNYKYDGTITKGAKNWVNSKEYLRLKDELAEAHRCLAAYRKSLHGKLANEILRVGNKLKIEKNSYKTFQKNFGKSVARRAPAMFVSELIRKAESAGGEAWDMPAQSLKLSQVCNCGKCVKKKLSARWHKCDCGVVAQRDLFSAHLARCVDKNGEKYILDATRALAAWRKTEPLLQQAVSRISEQSACGGPLPASFGLPKEAARQSGSSVNPAPRTGTEDLGMVAKAGDAVIARSYRCDESPEKVALAVGRTP